MKILTFSFDDCTEEDIRLVALMNKYGVKGTFNLTSSWLTAKNRSLNCDKKSVCHINYTEHRHLYDGHEIACHSFSHPNLLNCDDETVYNEIFLDKKILEYLFECDIVGMAYPGGGYNDKIKVTARKCGIKYARTVTRTYGFAPPADPLEWKPTCHFKNPEREELADKFLSLDTEGDAVFYIWGHSYEFETEDDWSSFEALLSRLSGRDDVLYLTNSETLSALGI